MFLHSSSESQHTQGWRHIFVSYNGAKDGCDRLKIGFVPRRWRFVSVKWLPRHPAETRKSIAGAPTVRRTPEKILKMRMLGLSIDIFRLTTIFLGCRRFNSLFVFSFGQFYSKIIDPFLCQKEKLCLAPFIENNFNCDWIDVYFKFSLQQSRGQPIFSKGGSVHTVNLRNYLTYIFWNFVFLYFHIFVL